jgi:hypothetical protein
MNAELGNALRDQSDREVLWLRLRNKLDLAGHEELTRSDSKY